MSNDVIIPQTTVHGPAAIFHGQHEAVAEDMGLGYSVVSAVGKTFVLKHAGQRYTLLNPPKYDQNGNQVEDPNSDGYPVPYFDFIMLRSPKLPSNFYYPEGFQEGSTKPPSCTSTDGIAPDDNVQHKESHLCQVCEHFEWKDLPNGRKGRECQQRLRLAVLPTTTLIKVVLGVPITDPVLFNVPAASMRALTEFDRQMNAKHGGNAPYYSYVMRAKFKPDVSWPQFQYQLIDFLDEEYAAAVAAKREEPLAYRIIGMTPEGRPLMRRGAISDARVAPVHDTTAFEPLRSQSAPVELPPMERPAKPVNPPPPTLDLKANDVLVKEHLAETTNVVPMKKPDPVVDTPADIDALVAAMRPKPPGA